MSDSDSSNGNGNDSASARRGKIGKLIRHRPRVGPLAALIMSLAFALVASLLAASDSLLLSSGAVEFTAGEPAPITLRVPQFSRFRSGTLSLEDGPIVVTRGQNVDPATAATAEAVIDTMPSGVPALGAYMAVFFLLALLYTSQLRRSHRGRLLRTQAVTLLLLLAGAVVFKIALWLSPLSVMIVPVAGAAIIATLVVDVSVGLATGLMASVVIGLLVPFDVGVLAILGAQSSAAVLFLGEHHHKNRHVALAGLISAVAAVIAYVVLHYLATASSALYDLGDPTHSTVVAAAAGGIISAGVAIVAKPVYQFLLGDITRNKLVELEDLSNPLLKQIARDSPGTWQHSLAMANMAEVAANAIGASGRLVRVGAYYHDLGKSLQPKYFIENLEPGEPSPHDDLPPEVSCDAIFAHVTEGIRVARKHGLPERIIDFMHMHHGDGLLQYFWSKCKESGNPKNLTVEDFRYPGIPPHSRETAILAIVDAVEAASRTLSSSDDQAISNLVQRIVYGKLHLGQLDDSGLSMADLRKISNSLRETIKHQRHGRIEYPWQKAERAARAKAEAEKAKGESQQTPVVGVRASVEMTAPPRPEDSITTTQRMMNEPRLDSLDVPRPYWRDPRSQRGLAEPAPASPAVRPSAPAMSTPVAAVTPPVAAVTPPVAAPVRQARTEPESTTVLAAMTRPASRPAAVVQPSAAATPDLAPDLASDLGVIPERLPRADSAIILPKKRTTAERAAAEEEFESPSTTTPAVVVAEPAPEPPARQLVFAAPSRPVSHIDSTLPLPSVSTEAPSAAPETAATPRVINPFPQPASKGPPRSAGKKKQQSGKKLSGTTPLSALPQVPPRTPTASSRQEVPASSELAAPAAPAAKPPGDLASRVLARIKAEAEAGIEAARQQGPGESRPGATSMTSRTRAGGSDFDDEQPTTVADPLTRTSNLSLSTLSASKRTPPPPPGSKERKQGSTIELMKHQENEALRRAATPIPITEEEIEREDTLLPGTMVMGPPPATRPSEERKTQQGDVPKVSPVTIMPRKK